MKKLFALLLVIVTVFSLNSCMIINYFSNLNVQHRQLKEAILFTNENGDTASEQLDYIEELLSNLPDSTKDTATIREQYNKIKTEFDTLNNSYRTMQQRHDAAMTLLKYDEKYDDWNLNNLVLQNMLEDDAVFGAVLFATWKNSSGYYIEFFEKTSNDTWFHYNIPTNEKSGVEYYYYIENNVLGFCPQKDSSAKFPVWGILEVSYDEIHIFCYANTTHYYLKNVSDK